MTEYIERGTLMRRIKEIHCAECDSYHGVRCRACWVDDTLDYIDSEPAADVAPVRHGPCPYCDAKTNDFIPINQTVEYSGIEIALNRQGMLRVRVYESGQETFTAQDIVEIKCCPNCGAKMYGGVDDACL